MGQNIAQKQIYTKDKSVRITFRCDDKLGEWVNNKSTSLGLTPSAFVRQLLYSNMYSETAICQSLAEAFTKETSSEKAVGKKCKQ